MTTPPLPSTPSVDSNDKVLIVLCHLSAILGMGFLLPLIVYLIKRQESELVTAHAREALNFHLSLLIYAICCIPLVFIIIGIFLLMGLGLMGLICAIIAAVKASEGGFYHYPLTLRLIG